MCVSGKDNPVPGDNSVFQYFKMENWQEMCIVLEYSHFALVRNSLLEKLMPVEVGILAHVYNATCVHETITI